MMGFLDKEHPDILKRRLASMDTRHRIQWVYDAMFAHAVDCMAYEYFRLEDQMSFEILDGCAGLAAVNDLLPDEAAAAHERLRRDGLEIAHRLGIKFRIAVFGYAKASSNREGAILAAKATYHKFPPPSPFLPDEYLEQIIGGLVGTCRKLR